MECEQNFCDGLGAATGSQTLHPPTLGDNFAL